MSCPKKYVGNLIQVDPDVINSSFFATRSPDLWTLEQFYHYLRERRLRMATVSRLYKQSLSSLKSKLTMPSDLRAHVCSLQQQEFSTAELDKIKDSTRTATISIINSTITHSNVIHATGNVEARVENSSHQKRRRSSTKEPYNLDTSTTGNDAISNGWKKYKEQCKQSLHSQTIEVEKDSQKIMSQFHVLFVKSNDQISSDIKEFIKPHQFEAIKNSIYQKFDIKHQTIPIDIEHNAKTIIKDVMNMHLNPRQGAYMLQGLCSHEMDSHVDDILIIIRNLMERLPLTPNRETIKESQLCGTLVDAIVRPLLDDPMEKTFLLWSNIKTEGSMRPDFAGVVMDGIQYMDPVGIGEVKGCDHTDDNYLILVDTMRIAKISQKLIDKNSSNGVLGIQVIGTHMSFYITTFIDDGLYAMFEFTSIEIPTDLSGLRSFLAVADDLLNIKQVYKKCQTIQKNSTKQGISDEVFLDLTNTGKSKKRACPYLFK